MLPSATGGRNEVLAGLLARARWTPAQLADRVNERGRRLALGAGLIDRRNARRWVRPDSDRVKPSTPRDPVPELACLVLSERLGEVISPDMLGWGSAGPGRYVFADDGLSGSWTARGALDSIAHVVEAGQVDRRQFLALTGVSLTAVAHQWLFDPARVAASLLGDRVTNTVVDDLELIADARRRMDDTLGGGTLLPSIREDLRLVVAMLRNASYSEAVGRRLHSVAAEFGRLAAWVAYDNGDVALSQRYFIAALQNAHVSGDRAVGANILQFMSIPAARGSSPRDGMNILLSGLKSEKEVTPGVAGAMHLRLVEIASLTEDTNTTERARNRATELLNQSNPDEEPAFIYWFNEAEIAGISGEAALTLGQHREAERLLRTAVGLFGSSFSRDRARYMCCLARTRLSAGSVEHACATASEAATVIRRLNSKRDLQLVMDFRRALTPYAKTAAVRDFDNKHSDMFVTTST